MTKYFQPIINFGPEPIKGSLFLSDRNFWFDKVKVLQRGRKPFIINSNNVPKKVIKDNALNNLTLAESFADAREIAKEAAQKKLDDISGRTAFNNALNSGYSLGLATQEIEKAIRDAATNAGLPIAIINAGIDAQGSIKQCLFQHQFHHEILLF